MRSAPGLIIFELTFTCRRHEGLEKNPFIDSQDILSKASEFGLKIWRLESASLAPSVLSRGFTDSSFYHRGTTHPHPHQLPLPHQSRRRPRAQPLSPFAPPRRAALRHARTRSFRSPRRHLLLSPENALRPCRRLDGRAPTRRHERVRPTSTRRGPELACPLGRNRRSRRVLPLRRPADRIRVACTSRSSTCAIQHPGARVRSGASRGDRGRRTAAELAKGAVDEQHAQAGRRSQGGRRRSGSEGRVHRCVGQQSDDHVQHRFGDVDALGSTGRSERRRHRQAARGPQSQHGLDGERLVERDAEAEHERRCRVEREGSAAEGRTQEAWVLRELPDQVRRLQGGVCFSRFALDVLCARR